MSEPPPVPEGVLVQSVAIDGDGAEAGYRIHRDGRYESRARDGDWVFAEPLDAGRVAAVERALEESAIDALPDRLEGAIGESGSPHLLWFQVARGEGVRSILVVGELRVPELEQLTAALTGVFRAPSGG